MAVEGTFPKVLGGKVEHMIRISQNHIHAIRDHGRKSYGDEACGVIYGRSRDSDKDVHALVPLANSRDGQRHRRFLITPKDYQRAESEASARGMELLGFYHSHPNHPAIPSTYDLEHAWPFFSYLIVSVWNGQPREVRSFVMNEERDRFTEEEIQTR
jgi:proteasome lid subunit RPN8/RPN11